MGTYKKSGGMVAAAATFFMATPAHADLTSAQVWNDWQSYLEGFGYSVTAEEDQSSDSLTVSDIRMSFPIPEEEMDLTITMSEMTFSDNGDGTVSVSFPPTVPLTIGADGPDPFEVAFDYTTAGWNMVVAGDATDMAYTYSATSLALALTGIMAEGQMVDIGTATVEMADVSGDTTTSIGDIRTTEQKIQTGLVTYDVDIKDPSNDENRFVLNGQTESLELDADVAMPDGIDMEDMGAALAAGFAVDGGYVFGPGSMNFNFADRGDVVQGSTSSEGGAFEVAMSSEGLFYGLGSDDLSMEFAGGDIPFPVSMAMAEFGFGLLMPVSKSDAEQEFGLDLTLRDFTMSDLIWGIFDPAEQLPRDPATIAIELSGMAKLFFDLMDTEQMEAIGMIDGMPGELNSLTIDQLQVSMVGAELTGTGDLSFDNSDLSSYDGMPKPVGEVNLGLTGGNALLDKLVAMGMVPKDQAQGARMMIGLFAVPGEGEDTLKSRIEFNEQGQILANGQRLK